MTSKLRPQQLSYSDQLTAGGTKTAFSLKGKNQQHENGRKKEKSSQLKMEKRREIAYKESRNPHYNRNLKRAKIALCKSLKRLMIKIGFIAS